jgi:hypothetical protein
MNIAFDPKKELLLAEEKIQSNFSDFTAKYFGVYELQWLAENYPQTIRPETVRILETLLKDKTFACQRQSFFLFRLIADTLCTIVTGHLRHRIAEFALASLKQALFFTTGHAHRATAEALGALPLNIRKPKMLSANIEKIPSVSWSQLVDNKGLKIKTLPHFIGRSLVGHCIKNDCLAVFKFARSSDTPEMLEKEILWIEHLQSNNYKFSRRFDIPIPVQIKNQNVFRLKNIPVHIPENLHPQRYVIAFLAHKDYFGYANKDIIARKNLSSKFTEIMFRNAWLIGNLTSKGVIHSALIPLFHNRVQINRRRDHGRYEWFRAGRLDRWLDSCTFPNLGESGLRDFEHFCVLNGQHMDLYRHMGAQFLSLLLVAASYFRNKDVKKVGLDEYGQPVDVRNLFDPQLLKTIIKGIFCHYYLGFTGISFCDKFPFDPDLLVDRMIQEMGVDRHMEEILRVADQNAMSDPEFQDFLLRRGISRQQISQMKKGAQEIVILSGPHLGGFNETISVPELIEGVAAMSAICISDRFWQQQRYPKPAVQLNSLQ